MDTVSKRYSACGARLGALVTKNKSVLEAVLKFAQARLSPPAVAQIAAEAAIDTPQSYFDNVLEEYTERRNLMVDALNNMEGVNCPLPGGAFRSEEHTSELQSIMRISYAVVCLKKKKKTKNDKT